MNQDISFLQSAIRGAVLVQAAYEMYDKWSKDEEWIYDGLITDFQAQSTRISEIEPWGFVRHTGSSIQIVFRGTITLSDWFADAEMAEGWDYIFNQIKKPLLDIVESAPLDYKIEIFGHSAGCALAKRLRGFLGRKVLIILYESPNDVVYTDDIYVVNNLHDIVTMVPKLPNYKQSGKIFQLDFNTWSIVNNHSIENVLNHLIKLEKESA